jgi:hypothetical protein
MQQEGACEGGFFFFFGRNCWKEKKVTINQESGRR